MKKTYGFLQGLIVVLLCASITPFMLTACKGSDEKKSDSVPATPTTITVNSTFPDQFLDSDILAFSASCTCCGPFNWGCDYWEKTSYYVYYDGTISIRTDYSISGESVVTKEISYDDLKTIRSLADSFVENESSYDLDYSDTYDGTQWNFTVYSTSGNSRYIYGGYTYGITELTGIQDILGRYEDNETLDERAYELFKGTYVCPDDEKQSVTLCKANGQFYLVITSADAPYGDVYELGEIVLQEDSVIFNYVEDDRWESIGYSYSAGKTQLTNLETSVVYNKVMETPEDVPSETSVRDNPYEPGSTEYIFEQFLNGEINAEPLKSSPIVESEKSINFNDLKGDDEDWNFELFSAGEQIDLDNDGENELILNGPYGGMYLDVIDGNLYVFAAASGNASALSYVYYDDAVWIVISDTTHSGRLYYSFYKFEGGDKVVDTMTLTAEKYYEDDAGHYHFNDKYITEEEYKKIHEEIFGT